MLFSSVTFLCLFLTICLLAYFIVPRRFKNAVLLLFSLVFYAWGEPVYILLMLASIVVAYITGILSDKAVFNANEPIFPFKFRGKIAEGGKSKRELPKWTNKAAMWSAVVWNIGLLLFFKYTDFFIGASNNLFSLNIKPLGISLPIGISFYSFQTLSYVIDVYRGNCKAQKNFIDLATYVSLFPQLIAGPIVRYIDVANQLKNRKESFGKFAEGAWRFAVGMGKKVILANNIGELFDTVSGTSQAHMSVLGSWLGIFAFTFQIYFDFSGYSDMAIGLGKMFGFDFLENFNYPYISRTITEFWRRWHMSLSGWFRDYVYIPLGGNRKGKLRQCFNIMAVWFLTGFWHGANWNFMLWGVYFGILLMIEKFLLHKPLSYAPKIISHIYTMFLVVIGWGIFAFDDTAKLIQNFKNMFGMGGLPFVNNQTMFWLRNYIVLFIILIIASCPIGKTIGQKFYKYAPATYECLVKPACMLLLLIASVGYLASNSYNPFLYFRF